MLKCLRQLADSGWFGSNWNTRERERLSDLPLQRTRWNIHEHVARTYRVPSVLQCLPERICFLLSIRFLDPSVYWYRNRGWGFISSYICCLVGLFEWELTRVTVMFVMDLLCTVWEFCQQECTLSYRAEQFSKNMLLGWFLLKLHRPFSQRTFWRVIAGKAQVKMITLMMAQFQCPSELFPCTVSAPPLSGMQPPLMWHVKMSAVRNVCCDMICNKWNYHFYIIIFYFHW